MKFDIKSPETLRFISMILLLVGGINWGFVGLFNIDIIGTILGFWLSHLIFIIVGAAAGYMIYETYIVGKIQ
jgi:uncharacterized membrane protein YuzA (DUF378 family)